MFQALNIDDCGKPKATITNTKEVMHARYADNRRLDT